MPFTLLSVELISIDATSKEDALISHFMSEMQNVANANDIQIYWVLIDTLVFDIFAYDMNIYDCNE